MDFGGGEWGTRGFPEYLVERDNRRGERGLEPWGGTWGGGEEEIKGEGGGTIILNEGCKQMGAVLSHSNITIRKREAQKGS